MATQVNTTTVRYSMYDNKHYELLASNIKRYVQNAPESITKLELGKGINMIVEMVERESMRNAREERNK